MCVFFKDSAASTEVKDVVLEARKDTGQFLNLWENKGSGGTRRGKEMQIIVLMYGRGDAVFSFFFMFPRRVLK